MIYRGDARYHEHDIEVLPVQTALLMLAKILKTA